MSAFGIKTIKILPFAPRHIGEASEPTPSNIDGIFLHPARNPYQETILGDIVL